MVWGLKDFSEFEVGLQVPSKGPRRVLSGFSRVRLGGPKKAHKQKLG